MRRNAWSIHCPRQPAPVDNVSVFAWGDCWSARLCLSPVSLSLSLSPSLRPSRARSLSPVLFNADSLGWERTVRQKKGLRERASTPSLSLSLSPSPSHLSLISLSLISLSLISLSLSLSLSAGVAHSFPRPIHSSFDAHSPQLSQRIIRPAIPKPLPLLWLRRLATGTTCPTNCCGPRRPARRPLQLSWSG